MIKTFSKFNSINEELEMSNDLYGIIEILKARGNKIAEFLMKVRITRDIFDYTTDFIDLSSDIGELSFMASNRANNNPDKWMDNYEDSRRQSIKTGRLVRKIINDFPKDKLKYKHTGKIQVTGSSLKLEASHLNAKILTTLNLIARFNGEITMNAMHTRDNKNVTSTFKITRAMFAEQWAGRSVFEGGDVIINVKTNSEVYDGLYEGELEFKANCEFKDSEIELFVNEFLALRKELNLEENGIEFKIVEGDDVAKYYHYSNYYGYDKNIKKGTLWNSCMRMDRCQKYFTIYTENPEQVKMLVLLSGDKAVGRALLWKLDEIQDSDPDKKYSLEGTFMDRIYSINDSDEKLFINYAIKNDWSYRDNTKTICFNREQLPNAILRVSLDNTPSGQYYPYVDTLSYLTDNRDTLMLSNIPDYEHNYVLNSTSGTWQGADVDYDDPDVEEGDDD